MRKVISVVLSVVLLLGTLPFHAAATDTTDIQKELINLACEAFPEYADIIQTPPVMEIMEAAKNESDRVVYRGTRDISENSRVSITVYQSGQVFIVEEDEPFPVEITDSSGAEEGFDYVGSVSYKVTCNNGTGTFLLNNVEYRVFRGKSGSFTSYGTYTTLKDCEPGTVSRSPTRMSYKLTFSMSAAGASRKSTTFFVYFNGASLQAETMDDD